MVSIHSMQRADSHKFRFYIAQTRDYVLSLTLNVGRNAAVCILNVTSEKLNE